MQAIWKSDRAVVLKSVLYQDRHRIVTALTENHGKLSAIARNSIQSRRFGGALELFTASRWELKDKTGSDLPTLHEATALHEFKGLKQDFNRLALGSAVCELVFHLAHPGEAAPALFKLLINTFSAIEELPDPATRPDAALALLNSHILKLFQWSGHQPQLAECRQCGIGLGDLRPDWTLTGLIEDASWVCPDCRARGGAESSGPFRIPLSPSAVQDSYRAMEVPIRQGYKRMMGNLDDQRKLLQFLRELLRYHIPGFDRLELKSLRFILAPPPRPPSVMLDNPTSHVD